MKAGDIAIVSIQQADGQIKRRPVLLLKEMPPYKDWLVCGISSQLHQEHKGFDYVILDTDPIYSKTGLKSSSVIRLGFLDVIPKASLPGSIGGIDDATIKLLLKRLSAYLIS